MNRFSYPLTVILLGLCLVGVTSSTAFSAPFETGSPLQPLQAWSLAPDGALFVLDAAHLIHELDPITLAPLRHSAPLADGFSKGPAFMLATDSDLWVGSDILGETRQLARDTFEPLTTVDAVGTMAVDPHNNLFIVHERGLWAYSLSDSAMPPRVVIPPWTENQFSGDVPLHLTVDPDTRQLVVSIYGNYGSPPHNRQSLVAFDLDNLEKKQFGNYLGYLSRPVFSENTGNVTTIMNAKSGLGGSELLTFAPNGEILQKTPFIEGQALIAPDGQWIYVLRDGGLWVLRSGDMALLSILPILAHAPADMLLSADGAQLYLFGNGWASALSTTYLHELGLPTFGPLSSIGGNGDFSYAAYMAPAFDEHGIAFTVGSDGEIYRSEDGARTWRLIVPSVYPQARWFSHLSISPDFAQDGTLIARPSWENSLYRSTDTGLTWQPWIPRLAFTSERDGNRQIYTADAQGSDVRRLTNHPGVDENPAWSPGWTRLVFQSDRNGNFDLYSVRAGCDLDAADAQRLCDLRRLTDDPADDLLPAWSPDGRQITFVSMRDGNPEIYIMDQNGDNQRRLTHNPSGDWRPAWTSDSRHILFTSDRNGDNDLYRMQVPVPDGYWDPDAEPPSAAIVKTPADERDAAVNSRGDLLFLSDHTGEMNIWQLSSLDLQTFEAVDIPYRPYNQASAPGQHPAWLDRGATPGILMAVEENGNSDIVHLATTSATDVDPLIASPHFDGHPAAGPVWWKSSELLP